MTREEAIKKLRDLRVSDERILIQLPRSEAMKNEIEALDMAIKSLEQQHSDDCVSRTQAIEWIENLRQMDKCFGNYEDDYFPLSEVIDRLKNVPPVTPTFPKGATNGNMVEKIFGKDVYCTLIRMMYSSCCEKLKDWWNAPYKRGNENG